MNTIKNFYSIYGSYYLKLWSMHLLAIVSLLLLDPVYFFISLACYAIIYPILIFLFHDVISHEYVTPKTKIVEYIGLFLFYLTGNTVAGKKNYHVFHHINWQNKETDPTYKLMKEISLFRYLFSLHRPQAQHIPVVENSVLVNSDIVQLMDKNATKIFWLTTIFLFAILPIEWFVVIRIYTFWLMLLSGKCHDYYFHKFGGKDSVWLYPIFFQSSWHIKHHENWKTEDYGPGVLKYINTGFWCRKLFYKND